MSDGIDSDPYIKQFTHFLQRGLTVTCRLVKEEKDIYISDEVRKRALNLLDYSFRMSYAWEEARELIFAMAPGMEKSLYRDEWISYLNKGLQVSQHNNDFEAQTVLYSEIGLLYGRIGDLPHARNMLLRAQKLADKNHNCPQSVTITARLAEIALRQQSYSECELLIDNALPHCVPNSTEYAHLLFVAGKAAFEQNHLTAAKNYLNTASSIWMKQDGNKQLVALCTQNLGRIAWQEGDYRKAIQLYQDAINVFTKMQDFSNCAVAQMNLGVVYWQHGELQRALKLYKEAELIFQRIAHTLNLAILYNNYGLVYYDLQQWANAEKMYLRSITCWEQVGENKSSANVMDNLGLVYIKQNQPDKAKSIYKSALNLLTAIEHDQNAMALLQEIEEHLETAEKLHRV